MAGYDHHFSGTFRSPWPFFLIKKNICSKGIGTVPDTGDKWGERSGLSSVIIGTEVNERFFFSEAEAGRVSGHATLPPPHLIQ